MNDVAVSSSDTIPVRFLFRKQGKGTTRNNAHQPDIPQSYFRRIFRSKKQRVESTQWTTRLAGLVDGEGNDFEGKAHENNHLEMGVRTERIIDINLRAEGPYFSHADPHRYNTVVCMVGGTGISGALAIGLAFKHLLQSQNTLNEASRSSRPGWQRCILLWSLKVDEEIDLGDLCSETRGLELKKFVTGNGKTRVDLGVELRDVLRDPGRTWVYISGPKHYIAGAKDACKEVQKWVHLDFYAASWDP